MDFEKIVDYAESENASDIHISPGLPVFLRITNRMKPLNGGEKVTPEQIQELLDSLLADEHKEILKNRRQVDFLALTQSGLRLRGNAFFQEYGVSASFRIIPREIRDSRSLGFPDFVYDKFLNLKQGLILVVGPTGEGKSTTLASMIQERAKQKTEHILTVEDPIEYLISSSQSVVQQREVGRDVLNFKDGITAGLREDPDILLVGEMRNLETISSVLTMAETGHMVFSTLHTNNGPETITRIIDVFPPEHQDQIRSQLSAALTMIISQRLIPTKDGNSLTLAYEVLTSNYAIQNYIRQNKIYQIPNVLQTDSSGYMVQFEQSLAGLVISGRISQETALDFAQDKDQLKSILLANGIK
ncbi:PilT/PilU family type 4a pilus ATPase [Candidatus Gracilibacteria bacterium]|nr:PilT/PilU family type 4a pilus ATPase [Candidatus Gracilibacteria bacterium]MCF7819469.1 PilT/PilU family type 4a pilus ATPase [Candidatus Gracilibacteria bacterium]